MQQIQILAIKLKILKYVGLQFYFKRQFNRMKMLVQTLMLPLTEVW